MTLPIQFGKPAVVLAPMEGVTDAPMRALMGACGGFSHCVAEFLRISHTLPGPAAFLRHVPELATSSQTASGLPVHVQLLGGDPEKLAAAAVAAVAVGARVIDLNFGCPARTVNRHDGGATLLRHPLRLRRIVAAVRAAVPQHVPVSAKLRLGWEDPNDIHANAEQAAQGGAAWLTIHGRTRMQGYRPPALWASMGVVQRRLGLPVVANGDLWTLNDVRRCRDETGCEHVMLGRAALASPNLASQVAVLLGVPGATATPSVDWSALLRRYVELCAQYPGMPRAVVGRLKGWIKMRHERFGGPWYEQVKRLSDVEAICAVLSQQCAPSQRVGSP